MSTSEAPSAPVDLAPWAVRAVCEVLAGHSGVHAAVVFGSRAKGCARPGSDVDLALEGEISASELARIAADLDARDLPWEIDLVRLDALEDADVRAHIERVGVTIFRAEGRT